MRFVLDECVPSLVGQRLRDEGHTVLSISEEAYGLPDERVLALAVAEAAVVITADKDFGELVFVGGARGTGVVLLRLGQLTPPERAEVLASLVREHGSELVAAFTVVSPKLVRIRPHPLR